VREIGSVTRLVRGTYRERAASDFAQARAAGLAEIRKVFFIMGHGDTALGAIGDNWRAAFPAKFRRTRRIEAVVTARTQSVQSCSHPILLRSVPGPRVVLFASRTK
jgi:hypothetical protein